MEKEEVTIKPDSTLLRWWTFRDCGSLIAFFSEKHFAEWYAEQYAIAAEREEPPKIECVYRIDITLEEKDH